MKAFLSYKFGDDTSAIRELLTLNNVDIYDSLSDIQYGSSLQQAIKNAIKECDFIIFIYSADNCYIAFEAGLAVAFNKPIFSILAGGEENLFLLDSTYVHAQPTETEKIKFGLELFLKKIKPKKISGISSSNRFYGGGEVVPLKNYFDVTARYNTIDDKSGLALEMFFQDVFKAYNVSIVKNSNFDKEDKRSWSPDFSIWSDELSFLPSNPIIVEIKKEINPSNIQKLIENLNTLYGAPASSSIVLYDRLIGIKADHLPNTPNRLFISIPELVEELNTQGFASSIKKIRNSIIHRI